MILNEEILKLAKSHKFDEFVGEKDDETDGVYWECWEEQLIAFAQKIYQMGYDDGCYETSYSTGYTGLFGEPQ
jgi:hypothetical protein